MAAVPADNVSIAHQIQEKVSRLIDTGTPSFSVRQSCAACNRVTKHVHYRGLHEFFVFAGLASYLTLMALSLMSGYIKGGITLYFNESEILAYNNVMDKFNELMAPYEYLNTAALIVEILAVVFCIAAAATLRSTMKMHLTALTGAILFAVFDVVLIMRYNGLAENAWQQMPNFFHSATFERAMSVQQQFNVANGFWGSPSFNVVVNVLAGIFFLTFLLAIFSIKPEMEYPKSDVPQAPTMPQPYPIPPPSPYGVTSAASPQVPPPAERRETTVARQIVYCYYCGAPLPTDAVFCRKCGKSQYDERPPTT